MGAKLMQEVHESMKVAQQESLEQHRLLISGQEASMTKIVSETMSKAPSRDLRPSPNRLFAVVCNYVILDNFGKGASVFFKDC